MAKFSVILAALAVCGGTAICQTSKPASSPAPASAPASAPATGPSSSPADGWTIAYRLDANKAGKLGPEWLINEGATAQIVEGSLVIKSAAADGGDCLVMLKTPAFPRSVKVEFDATLEGDNISDIGAILNGDEKGYANGYLLQFGGMGNSVTWLRRAGAKVEDTESDATITAGQKYHIVAQNIAGEVSLTIDGKEVVRHTDPEPLEGDGHGMIGLFTWAGKLTISNLIVSKRSNDRGVDTQPATQPVDEKAVTALLRQLGDDNYKKREAATQALIAMGAAIRPILQAKSQEKDLDAEVASRIQLILKKCLELPKPVRLPQVPPKDGPGPLVPAEPDY